MPTQPAAPHAPRRRELTVDDYVCGVQERNLTVLARALTLVESSLPQHQILAEEVLNRLLPSTGNTVRIGITGVPGAGKSTSIEALGLYLIDQGHRVAVLAVDPSSGITGGSILGDKTRMSRLANESNAFIRPSPSAGTLGGVARKTRESMLICEAAGYDVVLIETVGVGQSETMVAHMTDCFVALVLSGAGDDLQGIKRGLLEFVDVVLVNKAEGENRATAELTACEYRSALEFFSDDGIGEPNPVLTCSALYNEGIDAVWNAIDQRCEQSKAAGLFAKRRQQQNLHWLWAVVEERLKRSLYERAEVQRIRPRLERSVVDGEMTVESAAREILKAYGLQLL